MTADMKMTDATLRMFNVSPETANRLEAAVERVAEVLGVDDRDVTKALNKASQTEGQDKALDISGKPITADRAVMAKLAESAPEMGNTDKRFQERVKSERSNIRECSRER